VAGLQEPTTHVGGEAAPAGCIEGGKHDHRKKDAVVGKRVVWRSKVTGETRYGVIAAIIDGIECLIHFDDGSVGIAYVGNELSQISPA
jgi:hypothetical protein